MAFGNKFIIFLILVINWTYADARSLTTHVIPLEHRVSSSESKILQPLERHDQLCTLCEEYTALAADYLRANRTETEIMETLSQACSQLHSSVQQQQCVILVDFYGRLFFRKIDRIRPDEFCRKVGLCEQISAPLPKRQDTCMLCHQIITEVLAKLKDPDSQLEIIQILLKECNKMDRYAKECKRLVFRYGPLILANGQKFLESRDVCASIHACKANQEDGKLAIIDELLVLDA